MGRPASRGVPRAPRYSGTPLKGVLLPSHTGLSPSVVRLSSRFRWDRICNPSRRPQPRGEPRFGLCPRSLAATDGIDVSFYSCGYLDVSVPRVRSNPPMHSAGGDRLLRPARFPDSEIHGSTPGCRLPVAYRRLQRPSSPLDAKTSTVHPCELDHADRAADDLPHHRRAIQHARRRQRRPTDDRPASANTRSADTTRAKCARTTPPG